MDIRCHYCGDPIDPFDRFTWRRVVGWERIAGVRASGKHGGSDITLRQPRDEYAHPHCVERIKSGLSVRQESLL